MKRTSYKYHKITEMCKSFQKNVVFLRQAQRARASTLNILVRTKQVSRKMWKNFCGISGIIFKLYFLSVRLAPAFKGETHVLWAWGRKTNFFWKALHISVILWCFFEAIFYLNQYPFHNTGWTLFIKSCFIDNPLVFNRTETLKV